MTKQLLAAAFGWGIILWLLGYLAGIILFTFVPTNLLGWIIMPFGILIALWILLKRIQLKTLKEYLLVATAWLLIAVVFDYVFLVTLFQPEDGYYKLDVYLYYLFTFTLPLIIGWKKTNTK